MIGLDALQRKQTANSFSSSLCGFVRIVMLLRAKANTLRYAAQKRTRMQQINSTKKPIEKANVLRDFDLVFQR